jgi:flavorubredoxin
MPSIIIIYATRTNQTKKIAELIGEGLRIEGVDVTAINVNEFDKKGLDLNAFDGLVLGSATYHGSMVESMKTFLFKAEKANLAGKVGGSFGAFGWSGEAPGRIYDTMKNIFNMDMVSGPLMLKTAMMGGGIQMAQGYGREIADKLKAKT